MSRQKRARDSDDATDDILNATRSAARTRHKPAARILKRKKGDKHTKRVGHGTERRGSRHRMCKKFTTNFGWGGVSQLGWVGETADGQLIPGRGEGVCAQVDRSHWQVRTGGPDFLPEDLRSPGGYSPPSLYG
jgi:hypothetical protein